MWNIYIYDEGKYAPELTNLNEDELTSGIRKLIENGVTPSKIVVSEEKNLKIRKMEWCVND